MLRTINEQTAMDEVRFESVGVWFPEVTREHYTLTSSAYRDTRVTLLLLMSINASKLRKNIHRCLGG